MAALMEEPEEFDFEPALVSSISLRDYQVACIESVEAAWKEVSRVLIVKATGTGKTETFAKIAQQEVERGGKVLILAHTDELIEQAIFKLRRSTGISGSKEKADEHASPFASVVVGSVQTLSRIDRLTGFKDSHFTLVIVDEAHRSLAVSYQRVLCYFHFGRDSLAENWAAPEPGVPYLPKARILGVTATADRGDKRSLGEFFQRIAFEYGLLEACRDGYLVRPIVKNIPIKIDLRGVKKTAGDYDAGEIAARISPFLTGIANAIREHASNRKTVVFTPSIETARMLAEAVSETGLRGSFVSGACPDRKEKIAAFDSAGAGTVIACAMLLCLDMETEILTDDGWKSHGEITSSTKVANWYADGAVTFDKPLQIIKRLREPEERLVEATRNSNSSMCVTEGHRMIHWTGRRFIKRDASSFCEGTLLKTPALGLAAPFAFKDKPVIAKDHRREIARTSYNLRQKGVSPEVAKKEAERRAKHRATLRFKNPRDLTLDQCRLIGFWVGDGSRSILQSGGVEYTLCQAECYPRIIEWVERVLTATGYCFIRRNKTPKKENRSPYIVWCLPRGTGSGCQQRYGLYELEPFLNKFGSKLLWGLNESQFDAVVEGYWYADGHHGKAETYPKSLFFSDTKKPWLDLLQAIGAVRGYYTNLYQTFLGNDRHKPQWGLRMIKGMKLKTYSTGLKFVDNPEAHPYVWCVKTNSGNIITRRRGSVTIMGNTEGWDCPTASCVCILRPTKIRSLYVQAAGRGTRTLPGVIDGLKSPEERLEAIARSAKPNMLILDFLWLSDRLDLVKPIDLVATRPEIRQKMDEDGGADLVASATKAERDLLKSLESAAKKHSKKKSRTIDPLAWAVSLGDSALAGWEPENKWDELPATPGQLELLAKNGIDVSKPMMRGYASKLLDRIIARKKLNLCSPSQMQLLIQFGFDEEKCALMSSGQAGAIIGRKFRR